MSLREALQTMPLTCPYPALQPTWLWQTRSVVDRLSFTWQPLTASMISGLQLLGSGGPLSSVSAAPARCGLQSAWPQVVMSCSLPNGNMWPQWCTLAAECMCAVTCSLPGGGRREVWAPDSFCLLGAHAGGVPEQVCGACAHSGSSQLRQVLWVRLGLQGWGSACMLPHRSNTQLGEPCLGEAAVVLCIEGAASG